MKSILDPRALEYFCCSRHSQSQTQSTTPTITRVLILWVTGRGKGYTTTRLSPPSLNTFTGRPLAVVSTALRGTAAAARTADVKSERETYQDTPPRAISCEVVA